MADGILVVFSGFAGAGKGTLMKELVKEYPEYSLSVSMTTRTPRPGEVDGREYFFADVQTFEKKIKEQGLIEYAQYCGNYYGTPRDYVEKQLSAGKDVILEIEIQGMRKVREMYPQMLSLFVTPPSAEILLDRLRGRGTETEEVIAKRINRAKEEAKGMEDYDFIIINDTIPACVEQIHQIVQAQKHAANRNLAFIEKIKTGMENLNLKGE